MFSVSAAAAVFCRMLVVPAETAAAVAVSRRMCAVPAAAGYWMRVKLATAVFCRPMCAMAAVAVGCWMFAAAAAISCMKDSSLCNSSRIFIFKYLQFSYFFLNFLKINYSPNHKIYILFKLKLYFII
jgi:hypothetical protein